MTPADYIICATPRSGSTLLCDLLAATGVAGRPASCFRRESIDDWRHRFGLAARGADDAAWRDWFAQHQIAPLSLAYEVLSARPQATLAAVLAALGRDPVLADGVRVATAKLATVESEAWAARFRAEAG